MATTSGSGIKGGGDDTMAEADNGERDGRRTAAHNGDGDKHTRKKKIVLLCGDGPPARIEPMLLSDPKDCMFITGRQTCGMHYPRHMLQILSLKLAKIDVDGGPIELYGYMAARDVLEPLLNYVLNVSRNDPIVVEQGSLIEMTGPKRGIELCDTTLIEYDMRIKMDGEEEDDLQLIDGVSLVDERTTASAYAFTKRIHGDCGAVDITVSRLDFAVEATIEIRISE
ncbi:hypothetical protein SORBI_3004G043001 [Sorghum bicolor]|nr:hypothetical protein SORBI_3004G043001 [Sorghum bicolor]